MDCLFERLGKKIRGVFDTWNVDDVNGAIVYTIANEMCADVNVLHAGMGVRVMTACNGPLVIAVEEGGLGLLEAEFLEERAKPNYLVCTMGA